MTEAFKQRLPYIMKADIEARLNSADENVDGVTFRKRDPLERMTFTGERYVMGVLGNIRNEHYHRYLFALQFCHGRDVLDLASGEGYGSSIIANVARAVVGVDVDDASVAFATRAYGSDNLSFRSGSPTALPVDDSSVDVVVCFETIEHISAHEALLIEVARVLRDGGILLVSVPNRAAYVEQPGYHNPFHGKALDRVEFEALLGHYFKHVVIYEQQVLEGSALACVAMDARGVESYSKLQNADFRWKQGLPRAPYLVAVASPAPMVLPAASLLSGISTEATEAVACKLADTEQQLLDLHFENGNLCMGQMDGISPLAEPERRMEEMAAKNKALHDQLVNGGVRLAEMERRLYEMDRDRGYLRAMVTGARERSVIIHEEHARAKSALKERMVALEMEVAAAKAEFAAQIEAIRTSTSWRLTGPLRVIVRAIRRVIR